MRIGEFSIEHGGRVFVVAELSANHGQRFDVAEKTLRAMKDAGADAVKLQTFRPESMTLNSDLPQFQARTGTIWEGRRLFDLYKEAQTPYEWHPQLQRIAKDIGLEFFSSPFDVEASDFLEKLDLPAYKIASPEITDIPLIRHVAKKGKPVILSSGIATWEELERAVATCRDAGNRQIAVLKCTTAYPAKVNDANLRSIPIITAQLSVLSGISDHTPGFIVPAAATALGGNIIEKHFILDRSMNTLDASFSMEPKEFREMVDIVRDVETALGETKYKLGQGGIKGRASARSVYIISNLKKGDLLSTQNCKTLRPAGGEDPALLPIILGNRVSRAIEKGTPFEMSMIDSETPTGSS